MFVHTCPTHLQYMSLLEILFQNYGYYYGIPLWTPLQILTDTQDL